MGQVSKPSPPPPHFWRQWFLDSSVCVSSISACLQDELLCFQGLSEMVHSSLMACIKMGVSSTNPNRQLYHSLDTQKYCTCWYQWVALLLRLLLSYPGIVAWITRVGLMKIKKGKNVTLHNFVQCSCKNIEQKCFIYHQIIISWWLRESQKMPD